MDLNAAESTIQQAESENGVDKLKSSSYATPVGNYKLKVLQSSLNLVVHIIIGAVVGITLIFAFAGGLLPLGATQLHIILCVIGYQLLMAEAILCLSPNNTWSSYFKLVHKRRAHWVLQLSGSGLAIAGSCIKILDKDVHWDTTHGQFALITLIFTILSLVNGLTSLWGYKLRSILPEKLSKFTHICFGIVTFTISSVTLCNGFRKDMFRYWVSDEIAYAIILLNSISTHVVIINPMLTFLTKSIKKCCT